MKKLLVYAFATLCLLAALTGCSQKSADNTETKDDPAPETQTINGIVNRSDDYLVLLDDEGGYHIFDFGTEVDASSLEEGDSVTVTYTGTLDSEDPAPVATAIEKAA